MSELIQKNDNRATIRWKLLTGASAMALTAYVSSAAAAKAEDASRPQVWIELGGQLGRLQDSQELFTPPFVALTPPDFTPPQKAERPPLYGLDENGKLSFQPDNSDWIFSASIRYGRASSGRHVRHQTHSDAYTAHGEGHSSYYGVYNHYSFTNKVYPLAARFTDATAKESESHVILDFQAGKDLGLGLFGHDASSTLNVGVRIAQFGSKSRAKLEEDPDWRFQTRIKTFHASGYYYGYHYSRYFAQQKVQQPYHSFAGTFRADRSFKGLGPSISWNSSVPFAGNSQDGGLSLDWGVNAAVLFGRQKTKTHHQTTALYHKAIPHGFNYGTTRGTRATLYHNPATPDHTRSRNVTVPNVGGFAGISFNYADAKVSFGYRADFFLGAIDGGIDTRKDENRAFYGPFASISVGLGD